MKRALQHRLTDHRAAADGFLFYEHRLTSSGPVLPFLRFWHCLQISRLSYLLTFFASR